MLYFLHLWVLDYIKIQKSISVTIERMIELMGEGGKKEKMGNWGTGKMYNILIQTETQCYIYKMIIC